MSTRSRLSSLLVMLTLISACGDGDAVDTTGAPDGTTTSTTSTTATTASSSSSTSEPSPTTTTSSSTTTAPGSTTTTLPGEDFELGPMSGASLAVVGVAHDDVLNLRLAPGTDQTILLGLPPTTDGLIATGRARLLPRSIWFEVSSDGTTGWASARFLGYVGLTDDLTSRVVDDLGEIPVAETMMDLGLIVAEVFAIDEAEAASSITMTVAPTVGDLGEVTYDVVGLLDDAQLGYRLHVFGQPTESGEGFSLKSVEATLLCGRGISGGLCV